MTISTIRLPHTTPRPPIVPVIIPIVIPLPPLPLLIPPIPPLVLRQIRSQATNDRANRHIALAVLAAAAELAPSEAADQRARDAHAQPLQRGVEVLVELAADAGPAAAAAARARARVGVAPAAGLVAAGAGARALRGDEVALRAAVGLHLVVLLRREIRAGLVGAGLVGVVEGGVAGVVAGGLGGGVSRLEEGWMGWENVLRGTARFR